METIAPVSKTLFLIPYYNHPAKISHLVKILSDYNLDILIVDDGSNEESKAKLLELKQEKVQILWRKKNGGKGAAIKDGLAFALSHGYTHAFQIDADMQHDIGKIAIFLELSTKNPQSFICATPIFENAPKTRAYGRKITDFWVWVNTLGGNLKDSMCGFRIYALLPLKPLLPKLRANRMDFDIEILMCAYKADIEIFWEEITVAYEVGGVSHFKAWRDNYLISLLHCRQFFALPKYALKKITQNKSSMQDSNLTNPTNKKWHERIERGSRFWLNLTFVLVSSMPHFILDIIVRIVAFMYFVFSKEERENLKNFYKHLHNFQRKNNIPLSPKKIFAHFYLFAWSICEKMAVWKDKISYENLVFDNEEMMRQEIIEAKRGQILLVSHYGNIEIARALSKKFERSNITILVYQKNAAQFMEAINAISKNKLNAIFVENLDINVMIELQNIIERGDHIGIMGDRTAINDNKNIILPFLGCRCEFSQGAFLLAKILRTKISLLWCYKILNQHKMKNFKNTQFAIEMQPLQVPVVDGKYHIQQSDIEPLMRQYIAAMERKICNDASQWFNFYDYFNDKSDAKVTHNSISKDHYAK